MSLFGSVAACNIPETDPKVDRLSSEMQRLLLTNQQWPGRTKEFHNRHCDTLQTQHAPPEISDALAVAWMKLQSLRLLYQIQNGESAGKR